MLRLLFLAVSLTASASQALAQDVLRGHGGPVRAMAVSAETRELVSGSFDSTVIVWDLERNAAKRVLRFHNGPVNAVALLSGGCIASSGEDRRIAIWCGELAKPQSVLEGHEAPVTALSAVGGDLVSGSFDGTVRVWDLSGRRTPETVATHKGAVAAVAPILDSAGRGMGLVTGGSDGTLTLMAPHVDERMQLDAPATALADAGAELIVASADGQLRFVGRGRAVTAMEIDTIPLASLALSPDGNLIATAGLRGGIVIVARESRKILHRLTGPGLPVWSLAFDGDSRTLFSGGADRVIRRWDAISGKALTSTFPERDIVAEAASGGERGAVVFRACQACHTLSADGGNRAGPTLYRVFGRRIGTQPGYDYSDALRGMQIVWSRETIARLFEIGPTAYTPGTKMPEQTINDPADRTALVDWLERVTAAR
jgi:cytochrome c